MADKEGPQAQVPQGVQDPPALQNAPPPPAPQNPPPPQNPQNPIVPNAPQAPEAPHLPTPYIPPLNWSHFKPKHSGKSNDVYILTRCIILQLF